MARSRLPWALAMLALLTLVAGCAGAPPQPGPGDATLELAVRGEARNNLGPWQPRPDQINWDLGVYLVDDQGRLRMLRPVSGRRLTVMAGNPVTINDAFVLPPGSQTVRVLLEAYFFRPSGDGNLPTSLAYNQKDLKLDLKQGEKRRLELRFTAQP